MTGARAAVGLACALAVGVGGARAARAAVCGRPDLLDTVPADKAENVPPNASFLAHYDSSADYANEDVLLTPPGGGVEVVKVTWSGAEGLLTFTPPDPLAPGAYSLQWPVLRGLNTSAPGRAATVTFTVGSVSDVAPPTFAGLVSLGWDLERRKNGCTDSLENRFLFDLTLAPADDDGGRAGLTLVVFQTAGGLVGVDGGGSVPVLSQAMPAVGAHAQVRLPVGDATGHVCFAAIARDLVGQTSNGGSHELCVETTAPPFFRGCAVAPGGGARGTAVLTVLVALALARGRRRARAGR